MARVRPRGLPFGYYLVYLLFPDPNSGEFYPMYSDPGGAE
jgi:hypothetical protein